MMEGACSLANHKQLSHHPAALADELLDKLRSGNANESALCVMSNCARKQGLSSARGAIEQDSFRLSDSKRVKQLGMFHWQLNHLFNLLDLLVEAANHLVGGVRHLLHHHEAHQGVHLVWQNLVQGVAVIPQCHPAVGGDVIDVNVLVDIDDKLALRVNLHQHLLLVHWLHHLDNIAALLLKVLELLAKHSHLGVQLVPLGLEPAHILTLVCHSQKQFLNLGDVVGAETITRRSSS